MEIRVGTDLVEMDAESCWSCGSLALVETVMHDGSSWTHQLVCRDCRHVLESAPHLGPDDAR
jgi:hypothetical protein